MSTSVATTGRVEIDLAVLAAREQRLPQLLHTVAAGARCGTTDSGIPGPGAWHRGDGEPLPVWYPRRKQLLAVCGSCPVRAACEESALRQGEGDPAPHMDMVRGGRTGAGLHTARTEQADRLAAAVAGDERASEEDLELRDLTKEIRRLARVICKDIQSEIRVSDLIRAKVAKQRAILAARRTRSGLRAA